MNNINKDYLSKHRQDVHRTYQDLARICLVAGHDEPLLCGTPVLTYKTCGKANCKYQKGGDSRHGPYMAVQVRHDGTQRNLTLEKSEAHFFEMSKQYQVQMQNRSTLL